MKVASMCLVWVLSFISIPGASSGHDLVGLIAERQSLDEPTRQALEDIDELLAILSTKVGGDEEAEAFVWRSLVWPTADRVQVCFFDGSSDAQMVVESIGRLWEEGTLLRFQFLAERCPDAPDADIRISFAGPGYWSYVGTQARLISIKKQTMNLSGLDKTSLSTDEKAVILHEFGHALGFEHEHQSPVTGCEEEFNFDYLYLALPWPKDTIDRNMRRLNVSNSSSALVTDFDPSSIMMYSLDVRAFKDPDNAKCYVKTTNLEISRLDKEVMIQLYGPTPAAAVATTPNVPADIRSSVLQIQRLLSTPIP